MTEIRQKILNTLGYYARTPLKGILSQTQLPYGTVRGNLRDMRKAGLVVNENGGWKRNITTIGA